QAAGLWGKAGERSIARSALSEAIVQLTRALGQVASCPATPALRCEEIKLQLALANVLMHVRGYSSPQASAAFEHAGTMLDRAEAAGDELDPLLRFAVMY